MLYKIWKSYIYRLYHNEYMSPTQHMGLSVCISIKYQTRFSTFGLWKLTVHFLFWYWMDVHHKLMSRILPKLVSNPNIHVSTYIQVKLNDCWNAKNIVEMKTLWEKIGKVMNSFLLWCLFLCHETKNLKEILKYKLVPVMSTIVRLSPHKTFLCPYMGNTFFFKYFFYKLWKVI